MICNVSIKSETETFAETLFNPLMTGLFATLVILTPVPAVKLGVKSHVIVSVVISPSHEILLALSWERLSGSDTIPVFVMVGLPPTDVILIPAPAVRLGVRSHVRVLILAFVICAVPLNIENVGSAVVTKSGRSSMSLRDRLELNSIVVATCGAE